MSGPWEDLLPTSVEVCGAEYEIRSDYRAILDICRAISDPELKEQEKAVALLHIFYPAFSDMPAEHCQQAVEKCLWFIDCGQAHQDRPHGKLMDWEQDFKYIIAPINRVMGKEVRSVEYMHWWTFLSAYYEIGDCLFAQIVRIRDRKARGKPLSKEDAEWYRRNRGLVDFQMVYTEADQEILKCWGV